MLSRQPALRIPLAASLVFLAFSLLYLRDVPALRVSFWGFGAGLLIFLFWLYRTSARDGRLLHFEFVPRQHHYIQASVQLAVYAYWGWYWREVYDEAGLIAAQIVFAYAFDSLLCWSRRDKWVLGFGPFPIILSANLFIWFRDEWFYLQFLMIAVGFMGKEFVRWNREGRSTHIFNPSAFSLGLFSIVLILTGTTGMTWGIEISTTLYYPPNIYIVLFLLGLVVMYFFTITLVTATAAITLFAAGAIYQALTGVYFFIDSEIPVAVFLGLHLLVTDPSTSPRTPFGKVIFGGFYGLSVVGLYWLLGFYGVPTFYDKLLAVPLLNISVRLIDRFAARFLDSMTQETDGLLVVPRRLNLAHMGLWVAFFVGASVMGAFGDTHQGHNLPFWRNACDQDLRNGCYTLAVIESGYCGAGSGWACNEFGIMQLGGPIGYNRDGAIESFRRACAFNFEPGCQNYATLEAGGENALQSSPKLSDYLLMLPQRGPLPNMGALELFTLACDQGWVVGCGEKARLYLTGTGVAVNYRIAAEGFEEPFAMGDPTSCTDLGLLYERGDGVSQDMARAMELMTQGCDLGMDEACQWLETQTGAEGTESTTPLDGSQ